MRQKKETLKLTCNGYFQMVSVSHIKTTASNKSNEIKKKFYIICTHFKYHLIPERSVQSSEGNPQIGRVILKIVFFLTTL